MDGERPEMAGHGLAFRVFCFVSIFLAALEARADHGFRIRPYLFSVRGQSVAVAWEYEGGHPAESELRLYQDGVETGAMRAARDGDLFFATLPITPCGFGERLGYKVPGMRSPVPIENIPCSGPARFTFIADTQEGPRHVARLVDDILAFPGSAILHGGDFVQTGGKLKDWLEYFSVMAPVSASRVTFPIVGNHEYRKGEPHWQRFFRHSFKEGHYSFRIGDAEIFVLNSCFADDPSLVDLQVNWLDQALARSEARWKIVAFHHAPFSHSIGHSVLGHKKEHLVIQDYFMPHFEYHGVDLVLSGHVHLYERFFKDGIHYINAGPAGGKMGWAVVGSPYEVVLKRARTVTHLEVTDRITATTVDMEGDTLDRVTIRKPVP